MSNVFLNVSGDGNAYTNVVPPLVDGEEIIKSIEPSGEIKTLIKNDAAIEK